MEELAAEKQKGWPMGHPFLVIMVISSPPTGAGIDISTLSCSGKTDSEKLFSTVLPGLASH